MAKAAAVLIASAMVFSCSDINRQSSPVQLIVTNTQILHRIDVAKDAAGCNVNVTTVQLQTLLLQTPSTSVTTPANLNQVRVDRYQVSYVRTDGGHLVPASFVRSIDILLSGGQSTNFGTLVVIETSAINQAPLAALQPGNGGRDPETGRSVVTMDVVLQVFGQTLAGERVSGTTRFTLDFCYSCGGCA